MKSLKFKFFAALAGSSLLFMSLLLYISFDFYKKEKQVYLYDLHRAVAKSAAFKIESLLTLIQSNGIKPVSVVSIDVAGALLDLKGILTLDKTFDIENFGKLFAGEREYFMAEIRSGDFILFIKRKTPDGFNVLAYSANEIAAPIFESSGSELAWVDELGYILASPIKNEIGKSIAKICPQIRDLQGLRDEGRLTTLCYEENSIISYFKVRGTKTFLLARTDRSALQRAVQPFLRKSLVFLVILMMAAMAFSIVLISPISDRIKRLTFTTKQLSSGNLDLRINDQSSDEIGDLAKSFDKMAEDLTKLIHDRQQQASLVAEMNLASQLQKGFLPKLHFSGGNFEIAAFYEPAALCGGDWFYHTMTEKGLFFCIGDVTGHGLNSAMVTAAVKASVSVETEEFQSVQGLMNKINNAVFEVSAGVLQMTFFAGIFSPDFTELRYTNASHEPIWYFDPKEAKIDKNDLNVLDINHGPRLGEKKGTAYDETLVHLGGPQAFLFYTDGLRDISSPEGKIFGDRRILNTFIKSMDSGSGAKSALDFFSARILEFKKDAPLPDDVSFALLLTKTDSRHS